MMADSGRLSGSREPSQSTLSRPVGFDPGRIGKEPCPCGHRACKRWFLTGIGTFYVGSGFTEEEADTIIAALNEKEAAA